MMHSAGKRIKAYFLVFRVPNLIIIILTQFLVRYCIINSIFQFQGVGVQLDLSDFILLVLATILIAAGGYIINDYYDIDIDEFNKKKTNMIGREISIKTSWILYFSINTLAVILGFILASNISSFQLGFIFPIIAGLLWFYSTRYKGMLFWGNLIVALLAALVLLIVWLFEFMALRNNPEVFLDVMKVMGKVNIFVWSYALFAFLTTLLREWIKDVEDMKGDERFGCQTLPIVFGIKKMKVFLVSFIILLIVLLGYGQIYLIRSGYIFTFVYLIVAVQLLFIYLLYLVIKLKQHEDMEFAGLMAKIIIVAGVLSMELLYLEI